MCFRKTVSRMRSQIETGGWVKSNGKSAGGKMERAFNGRLQRQNHLDLRLLGARHHLKWAFQVEVAGSVPSKLGTEKDNIGRRILFFH